MKGPKTAKMGLAAAILELTAWFSVTNPCEDAMEAVKQETSLNALCPPICPPCLMMKGHDTQVGGESHRAVCMGGGGRRLSPRTRRGVAVVWRGVVPRLILRIPANDHA